jgi:phosphohistidine phosphatase SixA
MRRRLVLLAGLGGLVVPWVGRAEDELWPRLAAGGLVLVLRHERTEPGIGDPPGFDLAVCATQRNLSLAGRASARATGEGLRARGLVHADVRSSAWCRCRETAELLRLGPVRHEPALDSFFADRSEAEARTAALRALVAGWRGPGALVLVTHQVNITAAFGHTVAMGEGLAIEPAAPTPLVRARLVPTGDASGPCLVRV